MVLRPGVALFGGGPKPTDGRVAVLRHAVSVEVPQAERVPGPRVSRASRPLKPRDGRRVVPRDAAALAVQEGQVVLAIRVTQRRGGIDPSHRDRRVPWNAVPVQVHQTQRVLQPGIAGLRATGDRRQRLAATPPGGRAQPARGRRRVLLDSLASQVQQAEARLGLAVALFRRTDQPRQRLGVPRTRPLPEGFVEGLRRPVARGGGQSHQKRRRGAGAQQAFTHSPLPNLLQGSTPSRRFRPR